MARSNNTEFDATKHNIIAQGTKIVGNIISDGDIKVDGEIEGEIKTSARVVLGKTSVVKGTITCPNADILGKFDGELLISDTLAIRESAEVNGDISTNKLIIDANAIFNGNCSMKQDAKAVNNGKELKFKKEKTA